MAGGGGDAPPPPRPPVNGGEFLLHLLKNPPQHPRSNTQQQPPQPPPALPHDPAVAAVGPSIPFPSHGSDYLPPSRPSLFPPHNYFNQGLGFPQNPNPNPNLINPNPNWPLNFMHNHPINNQGVFDDLAKLGIIYSNHQNQQQQQQQDRHNKLVFGSLYPDIQSSKVSKNGNLDYDLANIEKHLLKERELGVGNSRVNGLEVDVKRNAEFKQNVQIGSLAFGNYRSTEAASQQQARRIPPPGFSSKARTVGKRNIEQSVDKGKGNHRDVMSSGGGFVDGERFHIGERSSGEGGFINQLDDPGPSRGNNLHSVPATDVEESMMTLHAMNELKSRNNGLDARELDELDEHVDNLLLEDGTDEKNDIKKVPKSRDKDYRSDKRGQWLVNQRMRNYRSHTECRGDINRLNTPFLAIYESLIPAEEEKEKQKQLMALLDKHVKKEWPGARLFLYGSCANSFGFRKSDIDVCLAMGDADINKSEILLRLADILKSDNLENVQALTRARVPIVKLMDPVTGISCDICVNNLLAVINTKLLRDYSKIDVRLRQLAFIVKHWAKSRGVNETYQGTLSSYAYVLMCIHFLQQRSPSILPCLQDMEITYSVNVDNVKCSFFDQVEKLQGFGSRNGEGIAQLVWAFFNYWAYCHDYANDVISIRTGSIVSKRAKDWTRRIGNDRHLICIEDPFEVSHDLGRVVDKRSIRVLREEFERAAEIMQHDPNPCVKLFEPYIPC
ncbi:UTP:RNA uridylyltransferase 1 [Cynara cardunculus var. scolymus]|uniref:RNA uridylyltransferase n=1 Tax=Cynara cardunculus var. scolymus TaxID=59895 RepID=A0A103XI67_CYNCS|nr:UTP:RNA uridylyltransferase 1 [Cynara cardunculus var. scolymus]KVH91189.1 PAP/25A-associated [Cynara cardunculus var. scolymus]